MRGKRAKMLRRFVSAVVREGPTEYVQHNTTGVIRLNPNCPKAHYKMAKRWYKGGFM